MHTRRSRSKALMVSLSALAMTAVATPVALAQGFGLAGADKNQQVPQRYVMTISGGISLGAYEAGFNWALLRYLKKHRAASVQPGSRPGAAELVAATGASAGNINAFLTAVGWCQTRGLRRPGEPERQPVLATPGSRSASTAVPRPGGQGRYAADDGLFTRSAFTDIRRKLAEATATAGRFARAASCRSASPSPATAWAASC